MTVEETYKQNLSDLAYVITKVSIILNNHQLSAEELRDLKYCEKVIKQVNEKIRSHVS